MSYRNKSCKAALFNAKMVEIISKLDNSEDELFDFSADPEERDEDPVSANVAENPSRGEAEEEIVPEN